ncbi:MAG TPA: hypothetical protein VHT93_05215 [Pseudolabrys sp.]|nr:hypothetical protein [Pseudolabrys sp.]
MTRPILIAGGRVLDPEGELHQPPAMDVLIEAGRIAALGDAASARASAVGAETIDINTQVYDIKNPPKLADVYTVDYLPPKSERMAPH